MTPREQAVINGRETAEKPAVRELHNYIEGAFVATFGGSDQFSLVQLLRNHAVV